MQRAWDDDISVSMAFDKGQPLRPLAPMRWSLSTRTYTDTGFYDLEPTLEVDQDDGRVVVYTNDVRVKSFSMAPESI